MTNHNRTLGGLKCLVLPALFILVASVSARAQTTAFTYQGRLTDNGALANGNYDLQFTLWDAAVGGTQQPQPAPPTLTKTNVAVTGGVFSVLLDFGVSAFPGADRFLEVGVRPAGDAAAFTILSPRQQISATPYALRTLSATSADSLSNACVGCVTDPQINSVSGSKVTGTIPTSSVPPDSTSYVQNRTTPQANSNFNISGNGTIAGDLTVNGKINANISGNFIQNSTTQQANANFNIGGNGIVGGNVGVGTNNPSNKLDVRGSLTLDPGASPSLFTSSIVGEQNRFLLLLNSPSFQSASGLKAGGILVSDSYGFANPAKNDLVVKGSVGIGLAAPSYRMELRTFTGSYGFVHSTPDVVTRFGTFPGVRVGTFAGTDPSGVSGGWFGTLSNDQLHFFVKGGGPNMTIDTTGNVGIGTTTPPFKLTVDGGTGPAIWAVSRSGKAVTGLSGSGEGVSGLSVSNTGVFGGSTTGYAMYAAGNAGQSLSAWGWIKALLVVNENGTIARCYNSQVTAQPANCGFTVQNTILGVFVITFPFAVSGRFATATPNIESGGHKVGLNLEYGGRPGLATNQIAVFTFFTDTSKGTSATDFTNAPFTLVVY